MIVFLCSQSQRTFKHNYVLILNCITIITSLIPPGAQQAPVSHLKHVSPKGCTMLAT
jgi:hypothetical protein